MSVPNIEGHICKICNKNYKTKQSLWNHKSKYHNNENNPNVINTSFSSNPIVIQKSPNNNSNNNCICKYCNKEFKYKQGRWKHEQKCKINNEKSKDEIINILQTTIKQQSDEIQIIKKQLLDIMNKQCKVHPKTLQKINKQLNGDNNTVTVTENNTTNNTTNNIINYNIVALGLEDLSEVFTKAEKLKVLKNKRMCLDYLVKYTHFNDKYPQFKNIMITNTQNDLAYKFDRHANKFIAIGKNELLDDLINERMADITFFYEEFENELDEKTKNIINKFLEQMDEDKFKNDKKKEIKVLIYNNRDKVTKDLEIIV